MRRRTLNAATVAMTLLLLAVLTVPAVRILRGAGSSVSAPAPGRIFGVYLDPWHVDDWARAERVQPQLVAKFESFSRKRTVDAFLDETERQGLNAVLIAWEPWKPVPTSLGVLTQAKPQRGYRNRELARGAQDVYIREFARSLAGFNGTVYLRYAHEMNGSWYPWSHDPASYRRAWRHVVEVVRAAGADNVQFVWSANPSLFQPYEVWRSQLRRYWPGSRYVDVVGSTMINFGARKNYTVSRFASRIRALRWDYGKPVMLAETNTAYDGRVTWLRQLRVMLRSMPFIRGIVWSQLPSRSVANLKGVGVGWLDWDVQHDPAATAVLSAIARDGSS